jgi:hypothetical protein
VKITEFWMSMRKSKRAFSLGSICSRFAGRRSSPRASPAPGGFILIGVILGCASSLTQPTPEDVQWAQAQGYDTTLDALRRGRSLYVQKCAGCHTLHYPDAYSPEEWAAWINQMAEEQEVKLSPGDEDLILQYLAVAAARARGPSQRTEERKGSGE